MDYTDVHIYEEHWENAEAQLKADTFEFPAFADSCNTDIYSFNKESIEIFDYKYSDNIKYKLKA